MVAAPPPSPLPVPVPGDTAGDGEWRTQTCKRTVRTPVDLRSRNLMIFYAPESTDPSPQVRYDHDVEFMQTLADKLLDVGECGLRIKLITRLGKLSDGGKRPLRITFADETSPRLVLSRLGRLKGTKIYIRPDLDAAERDVLKSAVMELKRRTEAGETNLRIVNFRKVVRIPRVRVNRPLTLQARPTAHTGACA